VVHVAGNNDGVHDLAIADMSEQAAALEFIAAPFVHRVTDFGTGDPIDAGDHDLLRKHVPRCLGLRQAVEQPLPLPLTP
jgi:hypothetical protein